MQVRDLIYLLQKHDPHFEVQFKAFVNQGDHVLEIRCETDSFCFNEVYSVEENTVSIVVPEELFSGWKREEIAS